MKTLSLIALFVALAAVTLPPALFFLDEYTDDPFSDEHPENFMKFFANVPCPEGNVTTKHGMGSGCGLSAFVERMADEKETFQYRLGRCRKPYSDFNLPHEVNAVQRMFQLKQFVWTSLTQGQRIFGLGLIQFGYGGAFVANYYDAATGESAKVKVEVPLGWLRGHGPNWLSSPSRRISVSAPGHCIVWNSTDSSASFCSKGNVIDIKVDATLNMTGRQKHLSAGWTTSLESESMNMIYPVGPQRAAMVHKIAAAPIVAANVKLDGETVIDSSKSKVLGATDYVRGMLKRSSMWHWLCFSTIVGGENIGIHLSTGAYMYRNYSVESSIFESGKVRFLSDATVAFEPLNEKKTTWQISSANKQLLLKFERADHFDGAFNYLFVKGNLHHMWGTFTGVIPVDSGVMDIGRVVGVLEEHLADW